MTDVTFALLIVGIAFGIPLADTVWTEVKLRRARPRVIRRIR